MSAPSAPPLDSGPSQTDGGRFAAFCRRYIRQTKGRWAGQPLILEPFQQAFVDELLEVGPDGKRVYTEALLGIPRKNGKSTLAAALGLYFLTSDGEIGPEVYAAAAARDQARVIFNQAREFVDASPGLQDFVRARQYHIESKQNRGVFRVLSSDARLQHGLNPSAVVIDELHAHRDPELYTALTTGSGARDQPLTVTITTAGFDEEQILGLIYNRALEAPDVERDPFLVRARDRENRFLMWWYGADRDADPDDPAVWRGANPAPWITEEYLRVQRYKPSTRLADFKRLHLNAWVQVETDWLPAGAWERCREGEYDPADPLRGLDRRLPLCVGIDWAMTEDATAVVMAQKQGERIVVRSRFWFNPYPTNHPQREKWRLDADEVLDWLRWLRREFPAPTVKIDDRVFAGPAFLYDPMFLAIEAERLLKEGLAMVETPQTPTRLIPAAATTFTLVNEAAQTDRRTGIVHDGNPVLTAHLANVVPQPRGHGWWLDKPKGSTTKKIDGARALIMAVHQAQQPTPPAAFRAFAA